MIMLYAEGIGAMRRISIVKKCKQGFKEYSSFFQNLLFHTESIKSILVMNEGFPNPKEDFRYRTLSSAL